MTAPRSIWSSGRWGPLIHGSEFSIQVFSRNIVGRLCSQRIGSSCSSSTFAPPCLLLSPCCRSYQNHYTADWTSSCRNGASRFADNRLCIWKKSCCCPIYFATLFVDSIWDQNFDGFSMIFSICGCWCTELRLVIPLWCRSCLHRRLRWQRQEIGILLRQGFARCAILLRYQAVQVQIRLPLHLKSLDQAVQLPLWLCSPNPGLTAGKHCFLYPWFCKIGTPMSDTKYILWVFWTQDYSALQPQRWGCSPKTAIFEKPGGRSFLDFQCRPELAIWTWNRICPTAWSDWVFLHLNAQICASTAPVSLYLASSEQFCPLFCSNTYHCKRGPFSICFC